MKRITAWFLAICLLASAPAWAAGIAVVQGDAPTSAITQDLTSPSDFGGATPVCALIYATYGTTNGTAVNHLMFTIGAVDGSGARAIAVRTEDATNPSDATSHESTTRPAITLSQTGSAIDGSATGTLIANGVQLNWTDPPPAAYKINAVLFGSTAVSNCKVDHFESTGVQDTSLDITVGFAADVVFFFSTVNSFNDTANSNALPMLGFVVNDGSSTSRTISWVGTQTTIPTVILNQLDTNSVLHRSQGGALSDELRVETFDSDGFLLFQRQGNVAMTGAYLALDLAPGVSAKVLTYATPTSNGPSAISGAGFTPQFGMILQSGVLAVDSNVNDENAEVFGMSTFTASGAASAAIWSDDANAVATDTESLTDSKPISLRRNAGAFLTASLTGFNSDGADLNFTQVQAAARQQAVLFIQESAGGGGASPRNLGLLGVGP